MKKIKELTLIILGFLLFANCSEEPLKPIFYVNNTEISFGAEGGEKKVVLASNQDWSASVSDEWVTVTPKEGKERETLIFTAEKNISNKRTATVTLTPKEGEIITISISQDALNVQFEVDVSEVAFKAEGGEEKINLTSNVAWNLSFDADWLSVNPSSGEEGTTIAIVAEKNENAGVPRVSELTITPAVGDPIIISISQAAIVQEFSVDATEVTFVQKGEGKVIELTANLSWQATSNEEWISVSPASGTGNTTIALIASENVGPRRVATVTITPEVGDPLTISVSQDAGTIKVFPGSDFEDWNTFLDNVFPDILDFAKQSEMNTGVDGGRALSLSGIGLEGTSSANIFRVKTPANFSLEGKNRISFYVNGTATPRSLAVLLYYEENNYYYAYNLGSITTEDVVIEPTVGASATSSGKTSYTGTIDTQNKWIKVSLNVSPDKLIYGYRKAEGLTLMTLRLVGNTDFNLLVDDFIIE